jgi:hypothetical protein
MNKIANIFANELFTTTKNKMVLNSTPEAKSPIKRYQKLLLFIHGEIAFITLQRPSCGTV